MLQDVASSEQNSRLVPSAPGQTNYGTSNGINGTATGSQQTYPNSPTGETAPAIRNSLSHSNYEELLGGAVTCPTCHGVGRIPRDKENELVALIPMSDNRLKPRRTTLWVFLTVFVCFVLAGLLVFFLFPRSVILESNMPGLVPNYLAINKTEQYVFMTLTNEYNVTNANFYSVQVSNLKVSVYFDQKVLQQATNNSVLRIPMKSWRTHYITFNITFEGDEGYIAEYCSTNAKYGHTLLMPFDAQISTNTLGRTENSTVQTYQHVRCSERKT